ncbi:MAG: gamma-glutamyltransferase [Caldilineae bacterium]|nr:MAG: gamma-glutamyltransferase [Caldilineae bacterium]
MPLEGNFSDTLSGGRNVKSFRGIIAAGDPQTAQAGAAILKQGGNAVDAAVAAAFASFVAETVLVNIGGGGVATVHRADTGEDVVYDFFCDMPSAPYREGQSDFREIVIDFGSAQQPFYIGRASVAVPGVVAGLCALAAEHGTLPLPTLLQPAIRLAREGAVLSESLAYVASLLTPIFTDTPSAAALYAPGGTMVRAGDRLCNPRLAESLARLAEEGADAFYRGSLAEAIVADQRAHGGLLTAADLAGYRVRRLPPLRVPYRGYTLLLPPPSSVGGVLIAFTLKLLSVVDWAGASVVSVRRAQGMAEALRLTNVARKDLRLTPDGVAHFLSDAHLQPYRARLEALLNGAAPPPPEPAFPGDPNHTTHISVIDRRGNVVSVTTSAGEGAGFLVGETGMGMNNMLGEIDLHPQGFHRTPPGQRLQTMMSPAIVLRDGKPVLALGSGGSTRLRSAIVQVLSNVLDFGLPLAEAVSMPRVHFEEGVLHLEGGTPSGVAAALERRGYRVNRWPGRNMYFGGVHCAGFVGGKWVAAGDERRGGFALRVR